MSELEEIEVYRRAEYTTLLTYHISHSMLYLFHRISKVCICFDQVKYMKVHRDYSDIVIKKSILDGQAVFFVISEIDSIKDEIYAPGFMVADCSSMSFHPTLEELFRFSGWRSIV